MQRCLGGDDPPQTPPAAGGTHPPRPPLGRAGRPPRPSWGPALAAVVTAGLVLAGGLLPIDPTGGAPTVPVAAIQGNVPRARNLPQLLNDSEVTQNHVAATLKLAAEVKAAWIGRARRVSEIPSSSRACAPNASRAISWSATCFASEESSPRAT